MKRGEVWTVSGAGYSGKPRPAVIVRDDRFDLKESITLCPITTDPSQSALLRIKLEPSELNGLRKRCSIMIDKITTTRRSQVGDCVGRLAGADLLRLDRALILYLGLGP